VGRWEPNARGRLEDAALQLYEECGFEQTTVAQIAERAGLTERTFYRHFADKREVLFWGAGSLQDLLVSEVDGARRDLSPMTTVSAALQAAAHSIFEERRDYARRRYGVIAANPELQERELIKLATLAAALADALRRRDVPEPVASLAAEAGIAVLKVSFERWVNDKTATSLTQFIREAADELSAVTSRRRPARHD